MDFSLGTVVNFLFIFLILKTIIGSLDLFPKNIVTITVDDVIKFQNKKTNRFRVLMDSLGKLLQKKRLPKALIVRINSPGGTIGATQEIHAALKKLRSQGVVIVALLEDIAASGGLYIAMAANRIVSNPGTITGSIGVIFHGIEYSKILEFLKLKTPTIKSGQFKDIMSPTREMTEAERALLQNVVDDAYEQFVQAVAEGRNLPIERVKEFADGRIFNGRQALALGLVDELGGFERAVDVAAGLSQIPSNKVRIGCLDQDMKFLASLHDKLSGNVQLGGILPDFELSGLPLWLMPR